MRSSRLKKHYKSIVCQDLVLCCQIHNLLECSLLRSGELRSFSYRDEKVVSKVEAAKLPSVHSENSSRSRGRDMHLYGFLVCWHLLNQRASPASLEVQEYSVDSSFLGYGCRALLRGKQVEVAVEKWNLFILARSFESGSGSVNRDKSVTKRSFGGKSSNATACKAPLCIPQLSVNSFRKDRENVRSFYVSTALYKSESVSILKSTKTGLFSENGMVSASVSEWKTGSLITRKEEDYEKSITHASGVFSFSDKLKKEWLVKSTFLPFSFTRSALHYYTEQEESNQNKVYNLFSDAGLKKGKVFSRKLDLLSNSKKFSYLNCPNLLFIPEMQDCAQSGVLIEGSVTLHLCVR